MLQLTPLGWWYDAISALDILRSPCGARLELRNGTIQRGELWAGDLICSATGRAYAVCNGNAHVYDEEGVSPLRAMLTIGVLVGSLCAPDASHSFT